MLCIIRCEVSAIFYRAGYRAVFWNFPAFVDSGASATEGREANNKTKNE